MIYRKIFKKTKYADNMKKERALYYLQTIKFDE